MTCGHCPGCRTPSCIPGYYGDTCDLLCHPNCRVLACPSCTSCDVCNRTSGSCLNGCDAGWHGDTCNQICPSTCFRERLIAVQCDQHQGTCLIGCQVGYYGDQCNNSCTRYCLKAMCEQKTGQCSQGCVHGYEGDYCNEEAGGFGTDQVAGAVGGASVVILWGVIVIILICVIWRRRQRDYEVFNRNDILHQRPSRGSSRRRLQRENSYSSNSFTVTMTPESSRHHNHNHDGRNHETGVDCNHDNYERLMMYKMETSGQRERRASDGDVATGHTHAHLADGDLVKLYSADGLKEKTGFIMAAGHDGSEFTELTELTEPRNTCKYSLLLQK